ncbi:hypothetical protein BSL82_06280 [Tardibacter chloracetimidivorans]|uniref:Phage holin family protein n=1 Tax=Tardibacter chloracetimidivorans TaxID=1921510 RepID=A0A1L3ZTL6_9SPHN|nr:phage holin family protein [Tardibacter chloracetimidivorans]API58965.1 hypothetical protein BSL82_06280 [Tardibacter chloracetimidivorans]
MTRTDTVAPPEPLTDDAPFETVTEDEAAPDPGLGDLFRNMLQNVRSFADAKIDLVRAICLARLKAVQASAIALVAAALLCLSALTALLVGLVMALGPIIGPFVATFAVSLGALAVGAILAIYAAGRLKAEFSAPIMDETREPQESYGHDPAQ